MLNEIEEFEAYIGTVKYCAENKYDSVYLGRFTYDMLLKFEGLSRVLTILRSKSSSAIWYFLFIIKPP